MRNNYFSVLKFWFPHPRRVDAIFEKLNIQKNNARSLLCNFCVWLFTENLIVSSWCHNLSGFCIFVSDVKYVKEKKIRHCTTLSWWKKIPSEFTRQKAGRLAQWKNTHFVIFSLQGTAVQTPPYARIFSCRIYFQ